MAKRTERVYIDRDNPIDLQFQSTDVAGVATPVDFDAVYSVLGELVGSAVTPFEVTTLDTPGGYVERLATAGVLRLRLGTLAGLAAGSFKLRLAFKTAADDDAPTQLLHENGADVVVLAVKATD